METKEMELLNAPLSVADIEFRVGSVFPNKMGFTLLAYKTARTDVKRLNSVFGANWKNSTKRDDKGNLQTYISIWNKDMNEWIPRSDIGSPSSAEKDKGEYSDSFKRAGFRWGIGLELYTFPNITIFKWEKWREKGGKQTPRLYSDFTLTDYVVSDGVVLSFNLTYSGEVVYTHIHELKDKLNFDSDLKKSIKMISEFKDKSSIEEILSFSDDVIVRSFRHYRFNRELIEANLLKAVNATIDLESSF